METHSRQSTFFTQYQGISPSNTFPRQNSFSPNSITHANYIKKNYDSFSPSPSFSSKFSNTNNSTNSNSLNINFRLNNNNNTPIHNSNINISSNNIYSVSRISTNTPSSPITSKYYSPLINNFTSNQNLKKKTLILDLDETLVHSGFNPFSRRSDFTLNVNIEGKNHIIYVLKRPHVDEFLKEMSQYYEIIIFTASISQYASPLLDQLDVYHYTSGRMYREHCLFNHGLYIKDLKRIGKDLKDMIIIDNNPVSYTSNVDNGIPILTWYDNLNDQELLKLIPLLKFLSKVDDVRTVINKIVNRQVHQVDFELANQIINDKNSNNSNIGNVKLFNVTNPYSYLTEQPNRYGNNNENENENLIIDSMSNMSYNDIQNEGRINDSNKNNINNMNNNMNNYTPILKNSGYNNNSRTPYKTGDDTFSLRKCLFANKDDNKLIYSTNNINIAKSKNYNFINFNNDTPYKSNINYNKDNLNNENTINNNDNNKFKSTYGYNSPIQTRQYNNNQRAYTPNLNIRKEYSNTTNTNNDALNKFYSYKPKEDSNNNTNNNKNNENGNSNSNGTAYYLESYKNHLLKKNGSSKNLSQDNFNGLLNRIKNNDYLVTEDKNKNGNDNESTNNYKKDKYAYLGEDKLKDINKRMQEINDNLARTESLLNKTQNDFLLNNKHKKNIFIKTYNDYPQYSNNNNDSKNNINNNINHNPSVAVSRSKYIINNPQTNNIKVINDYNSNNSNFNLNKSITRNKSYINNYQFNYNTKPYLNSTINNNYNTNTNIVKNSKKEDDLENYYSSYKRRSPISMNVSYSKFTNNYKTNNINNFLNNNDNDYKKYDNGINNDLNRTGFNYKDDSLRLNERNNITPIVNRNYNTSSNSNLLYRNYLPNPNYNNVNINNYNFYNSFLNQDDENDDMNKNQLMMNRSSSCFHPKKILDQFLSDSSKLKNPTNNYYPDNDPYSPQISIKNNFIRDKLLNGRFNNENVETMIDDDFRRHNMDNYMRYNDNY